MWQLAIYSPRQHDQFALPRARCELLSSPDGVWRLAEGIDSTTEAGIRLRVEGDHLRIECRGVRGHVEQADGAAFWTGKVIQLPLPCVFHIAEVWFDARVAATPSELRFEPLRLRQTPAPHAGATPLGPDAETIAQWLDAVSRLHRTPAGSPEFFSTAAHLARECTGLDATMVLIRTTDGWQIAGSLVQHPEYGVGYEPAALALLTAQPEVWRSSVPVILPDGEAARQCQSAVVLAPVVDDQGEVVAAVWGMRHGQGDNRRRAIRPLEARVVELLAEAVGVGMARRAQEVESARRQVLLEQAFSPAVVEHLCRHPEALAGQTREATLLFADLRGFTALAEDLAPADVYALLSEVMERLTQAVIDHGGVVIDYYGDGLSALWNAPLDLPDHADRACLAALQMLASAPDLGCQWRTRCGGELRLGIGVHAGEVQVGNAGTTRRLKYGPRGSAVNIASRVQAATRQLDVPMLITDAVRRRLTGAFVTLKACTAKLPGLEQPLELYTVFPATDGPRLQGDLDRYAGALAAFEQGDLAGAEELLAELLGDGPATPAAFLAQQAAALRQSARGRRASDQPLRAGEAVIEILAK